MPISAPSIVSVDDLRAHLQVAIELEHATIPPYFTAWLSANEVANRDAAKVIQSVLLEEMLHLTLAANLLNAIGGRPSLTHSGFIPQYPHRLPHSGQKFDVSLEKLSEHALDIFLQIEEPEAVGAKPQADEYRTIGQFYDAIEQGMNRLCSSHGESHVFCGLLNHQVRPASYWAAGKIMIVQDLNSALMALREIKEQGEGTRHGVFGPDHEVVGNGDGNEPAHYFRFKQLRYGRRYEPTDTFGKWPTGPRISVDFEAVHQIESNPRISNYPKGSPPWKSLSRFCALYYELLVCLEQTFTGRPSWNTAMAIMSALKAKGLELTRMRTGRNSHSTVGLVFSKD